MYNIGELYATFYFDNINPQKKSIIFTWDDNDYYHAWEPPFSNLRATEICCIITLESHHYI